MRRSQVEIILVWYFKSYGTIMNNIRSICHVFLLNFKRKRHYLRTNNTQLKVESSNRGSRNPKNHFKTRAYGSQTCYETNQLEISGGLHPCHFIPSFFTWTPLKRSIWWCPSLVWIKCKFLNVISLFYALPLLGETWVVCVYTSYVTK